MKGLLISELKLNEFYKCRLSGRLMRVDKIIINDGSDDWAEASVYNQNTCKYDRIVIDDHFLIEA